MQDWQIAVLVVVIVVFVALATPLIFLIYRVGSNRRRYSSKRTNKTTSRYADSSYCAKHGIVDAGDAFGQLFRCDPRIHPSTHLLYFLDFQGELHWIDFNRKPAAKIDTESALQQYIFETFHPMVEEGNRVVPLRPEMLALSYMNDQQSLLVLDLNRLLARDTEFGARMRHTAERPLLLSRLVADVADGAVFTALSRYGYTAGDASVPPVTQTSMQCRALVAASPPQQHQQQIEVDLSTSRANPMAAAPAVSASMPDTHVPPPTVRPPVAPHLPPPSNFSSPYACDASGMAPAPVIHPYDTHHITTSTPVSITATSYMVVNANGSRTELDAMNTARIEGARLRWDRRQSLVVPFTSGVLSGYHCIIDPVTEEVTLSTESAARAANVNGMESIVCQRADALYYTVERVNSTQWLPFVKAFYLPAGRWCVRARATLYCDNSSKTIAKVFTVSVI
ncbi:conserved hypothetical protein [Leishmania major strain Friedlin]|uniref:Uncharacterized protein n=1 Tax=Leishmania major TaxID=5664 RepID=Q4Q1H6_LEIMA|nr:conserved hypothetical protein [Leishmania major strain Friedlin]CAG9583777.1 hypothetical_protein_-_conserved [Leishmania major strain Friedlin]CAJ09203.1 conserved hypothetical protein [Leishmania major strain Friedlin]|eukprot:XP_001686822.1 conserved hypothetical protein [Leishmania major strain Friedlin]